MGRIVVVFVVLLCFGCRTSEVVKGPFKLKKVEHKIDASFGGIDRTILTDEKGSTYVVRGLVDTPPLGSVVIVRERKNTKSIVEEHKP